MSRIAVGVVSQKTCASDTQARTDFFDESWLTALAFSTPNAAIASFLRIQAGECGMEDQVLIELGAVSEETLCVVVGEFIENNQILCQDIGVDRCE